MKFLCDVHISYKIVKHLISLGFDAIHVNDILNKSEIKDSSFTRTLSIKNVFSNYNAPLMTIDSENMPAIHL